jgi:hypothetical protein
VRSRLEAAQCTGHMREREGHPSRQVEVLLDPEPEPGRRARAHAVSCANSTWANEGLVSFAGYVF